MNGWGIALFGQSLFTFQNAKALAVDVNQQIFVLDGGAGIIYVLSPTGTLLRQSATMSVLRNASDIDAQSGRGIFVVNPHTHQLLQFSQNLQLSTTINLNIEAQTELERLGANSFGCDLSIEAPANPISLAVDYSGAYFFLDDAQRFVTKHQSNHVPEAQFGYYGISSESALSGAEALAFPPNGSVYVADALLQKIKVYDDNGLFLYDFADNFPHLINIGFSGGRIIVIEKDAIKVYSTGGLRQKVYPFHRNETLRDAVYANGFIWQLTATHLYRIQP